MLTLIPLDSDLCGKNRPCRSKEEDEPAALRQLPKTDVINRSHLYKKKFCFPLEANLNDLTIYRKAGINWKAHKYTVKSLYYTADTVLYKNFV